MPSNGIIANVDNSCNRQPLLGLENVMYVFSRSDFTYDENVINNHVIENIAGTGYKITGYRQGIDSGFDLLVAENRPNKYTHYIKIEPWDEKSDQIKNLDNLEDLIFIVERIGGKNKYSGDGAFQVFGLEKGLYKNTSNQRANDNDGVPIYEFTSLPGKEEKFSKWIFFDTDYQTSKDILEGLTSGDWILDTGYWNDTGVWVDSETWKDN